MKEELVAIFRRVGERDPRGLTDLYAFQEVPPTSLSAHDCLLLYDTCDICLMRALGA